VKNFQKFVLEMTPLGVKICGESEFNIFEAKKRFPDSEKACILKRKVAKMRFLQLFAAFPGPGKRFFALKISRMFLSIEGSFPEKNLENFFMWMAPLLCSSSSV
jgi:hypothetical protein